MRVFRWTLHALFSHWWRHKLQFFSVLAGLWLATSLLTGVQAINAQARDSYTKASQLLGSGATFTVVSRAGGAFAQDDFVALRLAGWQVSPVLQGSLEVLDAQQQSERLQVLGIEPLSLPSEAAIAGESNESGTANDGLSFITLPGQTWVAADTLHSLGWQPGDRPLTANGQQLPPVQVRTQMAPGMLVVDIGIAQRLLDAPQRVSKLLGSGVPPSGARPSGLPPSGSSPSGARPDEARPQNLASVAMPLDLASRLRVEARQDDGDLAKLTESFHLNLSALGMLAFVVGLFIVHASIGLALEQRRGLLRSLRACGVSARCLLAALSCELLGMALLAGIAGVVTGYGLATLLLPSVTASLRGLYGAQIAGSLTLSPMWWLSGIGVAVLGACLAGVSSLVRAARLPLLAIAQAQAWRQAQAHWLRRQAWLALFLAAMAAGAWCFGASLQAGFVLLAGLLLAAALALPVCLSGVLRWLQPWCRGPLSQWFIADSRQQLPALSLALMALLLALAANIGVGSMTEGFRQTFDDWLTQRLSAELYLRPQTPQQSVELEHWLHARTDVDAVLPNVEVELALQGWPTRITGVNDDPTYREHWPLLNAQPHAWDRWAAGEGVMLSEQLARHLHIDLGDQLDLPTSTGVWALTVVAIYADYGNPKGHVLLPNPRLRAHWPDLQPVRFSLRMNPQAVPALKQAIQTRFALDDTQLVDQSAFKASAESVFERTFAATAALNTLTLGVAGVAFFISLLTLSESRLSQLAPLWALGVDRRRLIGLTLGQTLLLALCTLLLAVPLGLALAWCLVSVVNVQAFGWRLPMHVFPWQLVQLLGLALLATLLALAWPLWKLASIRPNDLLRTFASER